MPSEFHPVAAEDRARLLETIPGRTLPAFAYTDPAVLEAERETLFFRTWQYVCHDRDLPGTGSFHAFSLFDQDLFLVRGGDHIVRGFWNVCPHRGHQLVEGKGEKSRLICPYHAWMFDLTGSLVGVRRGPNSTNIPTSGIGLRPVRAERFLDFWFVNLDPEAEPLADYAAGLAEEISASVPDISRFERTENWRAFGAPFACNWKALVDNYLECYHCETAHPTFCDMFDCAGIRHTFAANHMCQHLPTANKAETKAYRLDLENDVLDSNFWFLFPNTLIGYLPGAPNLAISRVMPDGPEACNRTTDVFVTPDADPEHLKARDRFGAEFVGAEDRALVESVQRGMHQKGFDRGHFMIDPTDETFTEEGVRFFHTRYRAAMEAVD